MQEQMKRLERRKEFEAEVTKALDRTMEVAKSLKTDTSTLSSSSSPSSPRRPSSSGHTSVKDRLGASPGGGVSSPVLNMGSVFRRLGPSPQKNKVPSDDESLKNAAVPRTLGKEFWFEPTDYPEIEVCVPKERRERALSLELLNQFPSQYFPLRLQSEPVFFWVCRFCGKKGHKSFSKCGPCLQAWRLEEQEIDLMKWTRPHCTYPLCSSPTLHVISGCPTLHKVCLECGRRGHQEGDCTRPDLEASFKKYGPDGAYTKFGFVRGDGAHGPVAVWGFSPLEHEPKVPVQLLVGRGFAQWNHWGAG